MARRKPAVVVVKPRFTVNEELVEKAVLALSDHPPMPIRASVRLMLEFAYAQLEEEMKKHE